MTDPNGDPIEERLRTSLADHYAVQQKLGEGGMALVYLAHDVKHDRQVAIKVLRPDLAASIGADRFLKEIRHTAKLSHPHILPLYDSGNADGLLFYVMPFVEGESLNDLIKREKQLSIDEAVRITREVAEALGHAHSYGLVHRDIKPDNILMSGGHAIVADFGISKALTEAGGDQLTQTGTSVGTPAYMSPEQAMGNPDLDGRSDIYSLGCVLYQLLVGDIPFTGPTPQAIMARHTMDHITAPSIMRDTIPGDLEEVIYTAMAKTPADRFRTAQEFAEALHAIERGSTPGMRASAVHQRLSMAQRMSGMQQSVTGTQGVPTLQTPQTPVPSLESTPSVQPAWRRAALPAGVALGVLAVGIIGWQLVRGGDGGGTSVETLDPRRVAVLYFEDLSRGDTLGYLADGLTDALITRLSGVSQLTVLSEDAVAPYREANVPRDSIGRALDAGSLVSGSVEPVGERVRVTVRLVDGFSGSDIETRTFELPAANLLAVRDSAAGLVSSFLRTRLGEAIVARERRSRTDVVEAWTLVQRAERARKVALDAINRDRASANRLLLEADSLLAMAENADPRWSEPLVLRGWVAYDRTGLAEETHQAAARLREAIALADRALSMDRRDPEAFHLRGRSRHRLWELDVMPNPQERASLLDLAKKDLDAAVELDPGLADAWYAISQLSYELKDNVAAVIAAERAYQADAFLRHQDDNLHQLFRTHYDLEQFPNAQRWCDEGERRFSSDARFVMCQLQMLITSWKEPNVQQAWALARRVDSLLSDQRFETRRRIARMYVGAVIGRAGNPDSARSVLLAARAGQDIDPNRIVAPHEAVARVILGDYDGAIERWKHYILANPTHKIDLSRDLHWWWRPLRDHPEFKDVATTEPLGGHGH